MRLYFDGGCKPNPGEREVCVVVGDTDVYHEPSLGWGTNNEAEWIACLYALTVAKTLGHREVDLFGDSMLVVNQCNGVWKCKAVDLQPFLAEFEQQRQWFDRLTITHVRRHLNLAGIALETGLPNAILM